MRHFVLLVGLAACGKKDTQAGTGVASGAPPVAPSKPAVAVVAVDAGPAPTWGSGSRGDEGLPDEPADAALDKPLGKDVMERETIGGLKIGTAGEDVVDLYGEPKHKTAAEEVPATGDVVSTWSYDGFDLAMNQTKAGFVILSIHVKAPSKLETSRGIKIGSGKDDVKKRYKKSTESAGNANSFLVGSPYGGELFTFKDGKVSEIFLGAMAE